MDSSTTSTPAPRLSRRARAAAAGTALCAGAALAACTSSSSGTASGSAGSGCGSGGGSKVGVSLILKPLTNPYFVSMENDAKTAAAKDNVDLTVAAGNKDGDTQSQISAID